MAFTEATRLHEWEGQLVGAGSNEGGLVVADAQPPGLVILLPVQLFAWDD